VLIGRVFHSQERVAEKITEEMSRARDIKNDRPSPLLGRDHAKSLFPKSEGTTRKARAEQAATAGRRKRRKKEEIKDNKERRFFQSPTIEMTEANAKAILW